MKMRAKLRRIGTLSMVFMLLMVFTAMGAETGRISVYLDYNNLTLDVFRVGTYEEVNGQRTAALTEDFAGSGIDINRIWENASAHREVASGLASYASGHSLDAYRRHVAVSAVNVDGKVGGAVLENVEEGVYLFVKATGASRLTMTPFILTVPYYEQNSDGSMDCLYEITAYPKCQYNNGSNPGDGGGGGGGETTPNPTEPTSPETQPETPTESSAEETTTASDDDTPRYHSRDELPPEVIFENLIPLGGGVFKNPDDGTLIYIEEEDVPLGFLPMTGQANQIVQLIVCLTALTGVIYLVMRRKEKKDQ